MRWMEFQLKTSSEAAEAVAERLAQMGAAGLATEDPEELQEILQEDDDTLFVEPDFLRELPTYTRIRAYFPYDEEGVAWNVLEPGEFSDHATDTVYANGRFPKGRVSLESFLEILRKELAYIGQFLPIGPAEILASEVDESAWRDKWKEYFHPIHLSDRLFVSPSWETFRGPSQAKVIYLDPGSAFGSGSHESTQLAAAQLDHYMKVGSTVLDLGTGSGILAIAAALLGARQVRAIDISENAIEVCRENVEKNQLSSKITCEVGELAEDQGQYDFIAANLIAEILIELAPEFAKHLKPLGLVACSGIINTKKDQVLRAFTKAGYTLFNEEKLNDWYVLVFSY